MTRDQFITWLKVHNYTQDKYGHFQKQAGSKTYRYKVSQSAARYEFKADICGHNEWIRIASNYLKYLSITADGKLSGLKR